MYQLSFLKWTYFETDAVEYLKIIHKIFFIFVFVARCVVPCINGGKCKGVNKCRCPHGFRGDHCEIGRRQSTRNTCSKACKHGTCLDNNTCVCDVGWYGRLCHHSKSSNLGHPFIPLWSFFQYFNNNAVNFLITLYIHAKFYHFWLKFKYVVMKTKFFINIDLLVVDTLTRQCFWGGGEMEEVSSTYCIQLTHAQRIDREQ